MPANDLVQQRTTNAANEITDVTETVGNIWKTPAHDRNGNMTTMPQPDDPTSEYDCTYDAWNRLVKVETTVPATVAEYSYDGLNRRIRKYVPGGTDSYQHLYYNFAWQLLETRKTAPVPATAQYQTVYSLRYLDAPVLRDDIAANPDVRLYYTGDANFNVTSLFNPSGTAVERYVYDPYGQVTIYNGTWSAIQSPLVYNNSTLYTGQWRDAETGLMYYRRRYYHVRLGLFVTADPIGYRGGMSLDQYGRSNSLNGVDPQGTDFIAIADRRVDWTVGFYHYSLQYWRCDCRPRFGVYTDGYSPKEIRDKCRINKNRPEGEKLGSVELLPDDGSWTVWVRRRVIWPWSSETEWAKKSVWISEIVYVDSAENVMPIWGDFGVVSWSDEKVKAKWDKIIKFAQSYRWAEQEGFDKGPTFTQWPRSMYKMYQTNSNTFVRAAVSAVGILMVEMDGWHPGNDTPSQNTDDSITGGTLSFFASEKPWKD